jgi:hypothetical protein
MTYSPLLDPLFGNLGWSALVLLLLLGLTVGLYLWGTRGRRRQGHGLLWLLCGAVAFTWMMSVMVFNASWWGLGTTLQFTDARVDAASVVLLDYRNAGGDEHTEPTPHYRVHLLDRRDGRPVFRVLVGSGAQLAGLTPTHVVVRRNIGQYVYVDRSTGKVVARLDKDSVGALVPGLAQEGALGWEGADDAAIRLRSQDGRALWVSVLERTLHTQRPEAPAPSPAPVVSGGGSEVRVRANGRVLLGLRTVGDDRRKHVYTPAGFANPREEPYLDGEFVAVGGSKPIAVVRHATTTTGERPVLSGVALEDGAPAWTLAADVLRPVSASGEARVVTAPAADGTVLAVAVDTRVLLVDLETGRILWQRDF